MDDRELLREYVERQSDTAFAELVARHVNLVYATALRIVGETQAAQDVVQTVFILLARKAWAVRDGNALIGWLYRTTYRIALDAIRGEQRRRQRETEAMKLAEPDTRDDASWDQLAPLLDEAMQQLNRAEQNAVLLRFFEGKSLRETGAALGTSEDAAQMRVSRSLEKMRAHFARKGVTVAAVAVAAVLSARSSNAAPAGLVSRVTAKSLAAVGSSGLGGFLLKAFYMSITTKTLVTVAIIVIIAAAIKSGLSRAQEPSAVADHLAANNAGRSATVAAPVRATATNTPGASPALPGSFPPSSADPRTNLDTAITHAVLLSQSNDLEGFIRNVYLPPNLTRHSPPGLIDELVQPMLQDPEFMQVLKIEMDSFKAIQGQMPIMSDNGNAATYKVNNMPFVLKKQDGLWGIGGVIDAFSEDGVTP